MNQETRRKKEIEKAYDFLLDSQRKNIYLKSLKSEYQVAYALDQFLDTIGDKDRPRNYIWGKFASLEK